MAEAASGIGVTAAEEPNGAAGVSAQQPASASVEGVSTAEGVSSVAASVAAAAAAAAAAVGGGSSSGGAGSGAGAAVSRSSSSAQHQVEIKLFVGRVPQTVDEAALKQIFEEFGEVREVAIIRDKATGKHKNSAFVKMGSIASGDAAIRAIHNQRVLEGAMGPATVKYATGEMERLGLGTSACEPGVDGAKLFVGSLPRTITEDELREFFSKFGAITEVFVMRDTATGTGRGCAFVKMALKEDALYAIQSLAGKHQWEGCARPLEVRFAESKSQRMQNMGQAGMMMPRGVPGAAGVAMGGGRMGVSPVVGPPPPSNSNPRTVGHWREYFSPEGRPYYHNEMTNTTTWERPPEFCQLPPVPPSGASAYGGGYGAGGGYGGSGFQSNAPSYGGGHGDGGEGSRDVSGPPGANVFIFHVPNDWATADLGGAFAQFGNVLSARVAVDRTTGRNKGYGFVSFETPEAAAAAVQAMNGFMAGGKRLKVTIKKGEEQHAARPSPMGGAGYSQQGSSAGGARGGSQGGGDGQWNGGAGYAQTPGGYGGAQQSQGGFASQQTHGGFGAPPQQQQRFAPY